MSAEALEKARERLRYDTPFWARHCATILTPRKEKVRLEARPWQARTPDTPKDVVPLDEALELQRAAGMPMRVIIAKARKLGMSTWVQAKAVQRVTQLPFQYALSIAHLRPAAGQLMDMASLMYANLPTESELGLGFSIRPQIISQGQTRQGARFMSLGDRMRPTEASIYETLTAGTPGGGRASTPSIIHGSEVAWWPDGDYLTGLMNAMPMEPETIGVLESTANGFNFFYDLCMAALQGEEDETGILWRLLFYGWHHNPYNAFPFQSEQGRDRFVNSIGDPDAGGDDEEQDLLETFGVTLEQLNWRRLIKNGPECQGKIDMFHQEHPATLEQAFIGSGQPVFAGILVGRAIKAAEAAPKPVEGLLRGVDIVERRTRAGTVRIPTRAIWVPGDQVTTADSDVWGMQQKLLVWEHPLNEETQAPLRLEDRKPNGQYVVFVDVAQGSGTTTEDRDYSAIQVIDHVSRMQVARFRSRTNIHDLPLLALLVATYYNEAWLAIEKTGLGIGVVETLKAEYRYRLLYRTRRAGDDDRGDAKDHLVGWSTNPATKPLLEQTFAQVLKDGVHGLRDVATAREFSTYVEDPKNRTRHGAQKGAFDDLAISWMGAHRVAAELRPRDPSKRGGGRVRGWSPNDPVTGG